MSNALPQFATDHSLFLAASDIANLLGCSTRHVRRLVASRRIPPPLRFGRLKRWRREDIDRWLADGCPQPKLPRRH